MQGPIDAILETMREREIDAQHITSIEVAVLDAHGTALAPCSDAELEAKFRRLAGLAVGDQAADRVLQALGKIKQAGAVAALSQTLRAPEFA